MRRALGEIADSVNDNLWDVAALEWNTWNTGTISDPITHCDWKPWIGSTYGINIGESLGRWFKEAGLNYKKIHLISHSGGSWLVDAFADQLKVQNADTWIHLTLFDAFTPFESWGSIASWAARNVIFKDPSEITRWGDNDLKLGDSADYAEQFVDTRLTYTPFSLLPAIPFTDAYLEHAFNYDVTEADPLWVDLAENWVQFNIDEDPTIFGAANLTPWSVFKSQNNIYRRRSHSWPYFFYIETAESLVRSENSRGQIGFMSSPEAPESAGQTHDANHLRGEHIKVGTRPSKSDGTSYAGVPIDPSNTTSSATGSVVFGPESGLDVELVTGSTVSITTTFTTSQTIDELKWDFDFLSEATGEFAVLIDGAEQLTLLESDLREVGQAVFVDWLLELPQPIPAGNHLLTFALTPEPAAASSIQIGNVRWGHKNTVPVLNVIPHPWKNFPEWRDVNNDTLVTPIDALQIINELNAVGARALVAAPFPSYYVDVNGDDSVSPLDALAVINYLNSRASGEGLEPESSAEQAIDAALSAWVHSQQIQAGSLLDSSDSETRNIDARSQQDFTIRPPLASRRTLMNASRRQRV